LAGVTDENESDLPAEIVAKTSFWFGVGLDDNGPARVAKKKYQYIKNHLQNQGAIITVDEGAQSGDYICNTETLTLNGVEIAKMNEYPGGGHRTPYDASKKDPRVFTWLFSQSLECR
jgi:hypothetical protein